MPISIFDNDLISCTLDDSLPVLRHRWKKEPTEVEFKTQVTQVLDRYIELKKSYQNLAWLADTALLGELDESIEHWLVGEWEDMLFNQAGVRIHAVILGSSIYADYPMEKFKIDAEEKFKLKKILIGVFSNEKEAYDWIKLQQQSI